MPRTLRQVVLILLLASQSLAASGAPLPMPPTRGKDRSTAYPCRDRACGCMSADQCWRSCCCFTTEQKLAWAEKNAVAVPDYVRERAAREKPAKKACCIAKNVKNPSCCEKDSGDKDRPQPEPTEGVRWVLGIMALKCQGHRPLDLLMETPALPPTLPFQWSNDFQPVAIVPLADAATVCIAQSPLVPPPR